MSLILADTHSILWYLFDLGKLSMAADAALTAAVQAGGRIMVSAITPVEVRYLVEKLKVPVSYWTGLIAAILDPSVPVENLPVDLAVAQALHQVPRAIVPDMPDRIIAATALVHQLRVVTCDPKFRASAIW